MSKTKTTFTVLEQYLHNEAPLSQLPVWAAIDRKHSHYVSFNKVQDELKHKSSLSTAEYDLLSTNPRVCAQIKQNLGKMKLPEELCTQLDTLFRDNDKAIQHCLTDPYADAKNVNHDSSFLSPTLPQEDPVTLTGLPNSDAE